MVCGQHPDAQARAQCGVQEAPNDGLILEGPPQTPGHSPNHTMALSLSQLMTHDQLS